MSRLLVAALLLLSPVPAIAAPRVVADIPPVQGLVARVMEGLGEPSLLVRPGASPHGYALRPSEAAALEAADAVVFVGPELTPWLTRPIETLAPDAAHLPLLAVEGTVTLPNRTDPGGEHDRDHDHGGTDPHAWLDPENGKLWLAAIAAGLSRLDPANAAAYSANADAGAAEIDAAAAKAAETIASLGPFRFIVVHDAFQYFEARFGLEAAGAISLSDAAPPGPARVAALQERVAALDIGCALSEPQFNPDLLATVFEGTEARTAVLDPLGVGIEAGPGFYPALIASLADGLTACTDAR
ncbi:zinc transporter [Paracoccus sp. S-4012]|uniref:zinc ABC transporter substrate-binding protein n=1 Tax=Paracoccus sp. S-4012 TaxID=2665648 RepID=UPI0012AF5912|nr:zinc ABC transporter substrate-binding protein [Paracoccus sp. S-4012]MRX51025.1 zinc transporter [Paracoccus sp. S-4012]